MYQYKANWVQRMFWCMFLFFFFSSAPNSFFNTVDTNASVVLLAETLFKFACCFPCFISSYFAPFVLAAYFTFLLTLAQGCIALTNFNFQGLRRECSMCLALRKWLIFCNIITSSFSFSSCFFFLKLFSLWVQWMSFVTSALSQLSPFISSNLCCSLKGKLESRSLKCFIFLS